MDIAQPDQKRIRLTGHLAPQWEVSVDRQLPPPPQQPTGPYTSMVGSYSRSDPNLAHQERERRPSDLAPQYDSQEMRRPNSGPQNFHNLAHGPSPFVIPRDSMIKRDAVDEMQYRHTQSGMIAETMNVPSHHDSSNRISQTVPNYDTPRSQQYTQANFQGTTVPIPESFSHTYGTPSGLPLPPSRNPEQLSKPQYSGTRVGEQQVRKKAQRASQACDCCRMAKAKCDEGRPSCGSCKENGKDCRYRDPPPKQQDKTSADIMENQNRIEVVVRKLVQEMNEFKSEMNDFRKEMSDLKKGQNQMISILTSQSAHFKQDGDEDHSGALRYSYTENLTTLDLHQRPSNSSVNPMNLIENGRLYQIPNPVAGDINAASDEDDTAVEAGPSKQPSIPVNHTTGAARLLLVPPIKKMCADINLQLKFKNEKYPYTVEWKRGLLRLYGRGEGNEVIPDYDNLITDNAENTPIDGHYNIMKHIVGSEWGKIGMPSPSYLSMETNPSGANIESLPDFSRETVLKLVDSYKNNINNMHPILTPKHLDQLVETFLRTIQDTRFYSNQPHPNSFVGAHSISENPGNKRKRSPTSMNFTENQFFPNFKFGQLFRSISTAIVLLCMALGRVCQEKGKIPQLPSEQVAGNSFTSSFGASKSHNGVPISPLGKTSLSGSFGGNPVLDTDRLMSRGYGQSLDDLQRDRPLSELKNIDVIPGLIYFALATDIIGNQMAGSSLQHVHANILASLYHGQLGRVMESAAYLSTACRALQVILKPRFERYRRAKSERKVVHPRDNPLLFAFWTCLQLESDIVAEIPWPQSGILTYEEDMPTPHLPAAHEEGFDQNVIESYSAQLFLRTHLNVLHTMFYKPRDPNSEDKFTALVLAHNKVDQPKFLSIQYVSENLERFDVYAPTMHPMISQSDPPNDILGARLRAKYYGARVITYRPFVLQVLERSEPPCPEATQSIKEQISDEYLSEVKAPIIKHDIKDIKDIDPKALEYVHNGLDGLINSTTAFYGLGHPGENRMIVTNVWVTAHAQWGNVLTLQAAYNNPILRPLLLEHITKEELIVLIEKTMGFLALHGSPSSALAIDWKILDLTSRKNGLRSQATLGITEFPCTPIEDLQPLRY
ncbi:hypothetical protein EPUL_002580 [Erysiphe pulchra]|uniref:Zn(2)-C6 fungal-type domain-containing protein n=1 Tax=Erysiphe pulchra TaxID=225359 RepID=A0A2S4PY33_9PEZI|nr:hypothetical protein EPUL_002580 [Erysiphe pulchra]